MNEDVGRIAISIIGQEEPIIECDVKVICDDHFLTVHLTDEIVGYYPLRNVACFYITKKKE